MIDLIVGMILGIALSMIGFFWTIFSIPNYRRKTARDSDLSRMIGGMLCFLVGVMLILATMFAIMP